MSFKDRMGVAHPHELAVRARLEVAQWMVEPFGQGQIAERFRSALRRVHTALRWFPDLLAIRDVAGGIDVYFIDAKTGRSDTPNYCIEADSLRAHEMLYGATGIPVLYVMHDFNVVTPVQVRKHNIFCDARTGGGGSGTPYYLFPKDKSRLFHQVFGQPVPPTVTATKGAEESVLF